MSLPRIAVDAMGGDEGVRTMISGAALARRPTRPLQVPAGRRPGADRARARSSTPTCARPPRSSIATTSSAATRSRPRRCAGPRPPSMGLAIQAVKDGRAGAAVSAGNTGALMAMSKLALRTMPGIDRPALAALLPTLGDNDVVMLDLGANTECDARNLVQLAIMGAAYSRIVTGARTPRVRLLNIGTEDSRAPTRCRRPPAAAARKPIPVAVASKASSRPTRSTAAKSTWSSPTVFRATSRSRRKARRASSPTCCAARSPVRSVRKSASASRRRRPKLLKHHLDPNNHNGAVFLGLNGVVVKSHGSATPPGWPTRSAVAAPMLEKDLTERIGADLAELGEPRLRRKAGEERLRSQ